MEIESIVSDIKKKFSNLGEDNVSINKNEILLNLDSDSLVEIADYLRLSQNFSYANMCFGIDTKEALEILWYIGQPDSNIIAILKNTVSKESPITPTLSNLWIGFEWHEREAFDLLGIEFKDHPDLRRIYMPDNWEGFPLREDYVYKRPKYGLGREAN